MSEIRCVWNNIFHYLWGSLLSVLDYLLIYVGNKQLSLENE